MLVERLSLGNYYQERVKNKMTLVSCLKVSIARPAGCKCGELREKLLGFQRLGFCRHQTDP